jgi:hypothetical protein
MAQKATPKKSSVADDPRVAQALQNYEAGLRALQEHKFEKAKPLFQKVLAGPSKELTDRATGTSSARPLSSSRVSKNTTTTPSLS